MLKVIKHFYDLQDKNHEYNVGDTYPREGYVASDDRITELSGSNNAQGTPLIDEPKGEPKAKAEKKGK